MVKNNMEWMVGYALPKSDPNKPTKLVIPLCLQRGWAKSPGLFCMASMLARDVSEELTRLPMRKSHSTTQNTSHWQSLKLSWNSSSNHSHNRITLRGCPWLPPSSMVNKLEFAHLMEVYVGDVIQAAQTTDPAHLQNLPRAMWHSIHSIFPPPHRTGHNRQAPIHQKKAKTENSQEFGTTIRGWGV